MIKNSFWESLIWIIIWVFILSFIILWITVLIVNSQNVIIHYDEIKNISILKNNADKIANNIYITGVNQNEEFYIYKNNSTKEFQVLKWTSNEIYKYIDKYWNFVSDINNFDWDVFSRVFVLERNDAFLWDNHQIVKIDIKKVIKN